MRWNTISAFLLDMAFTGRSVGQVLDEWIQLKIGVPNEKELEYIEKFRGDALVRVTRMLAQALEVEYEEKDHDIA